MLIDPGVDSTTCAPAERHAPGEPNVYRPRCGFHNLRSSGAPCSAKLREPALTFRSSGARRESLVGARFYKH